MTNASISPTTNPLPVPDMQVSHPSTRGDLLAALTTLRVGAVAGVLIDHEEVLLLRTERDGRLGWLCGEGPYSVTDGILEALIDPTEHAPAHAVRYDHDGRATRFELPDCSPTGPYAWAGDRARMWREELARDLLEYRSSRTLLTFTTAAGTVSATYGYGQFQLVDSHSRFTPDDDLDTIIPATRAAARIELLASATA